jgi:hypothetical protein
VEGRLPQEYESSIYRYGPLEQASPSWSCVASKSAHDLSYVPSLFNLEEAVGPGWYLLTQDNTTSLSGNLVNGGQIILMNSPTDSWAVPPVIFSVHTVPIYWAYYAGDSIRMICEGYDPNNVLSASSSLTYDWSFGDGNSAITESNSVQHAYSSPGTYSVFVKVSNSLGLSSNSSFTLVANIPPSPSPSPVPSPTPPPTPHPTPVRARTPTPTIPPTENKSIYGGITMIGIAFIVFSLVGIIFATVFYVLSSRT